MWRWSNDIPSSFYMDANGEIWDVLGNCLNPLDGVHNEEQIAWKEKDKIELSIDFKGKESMVACYVNGKCRITQK